MKKKSRKRYDPSMTDIEREELIGPVKRVMQICYRAHHNDGVIFTGKVDGSSGYPPTNFILTFNEKGARLQEHKFDKDSSTLDIYNEKGQRVDSFQYMPADKLRSHARYTYHTNGQLLESVSVDANGDLKHRHIYIFNEAGQVIEEKSMHGPEQKVFSRSVSSYNEAGKPVAKTEYDREGKVEREISWKYDERGNKIEFAYIHTDEAKAKYDRREVNKYNEHNDVVEVIYYNPDGSVKQALNFNYEYDSEGKRIVKPRTDDDWDEETKDETEELEYDAQGNWIKRTTFFQKIPAHVFTRQILYFGDAETEEWIHPLSLPATETVGQSYLPYELSEADAKWLVEHPNTTAEQFSYLRYYTLRFKDTPSVVTFTGPNIEALQLLDKLKEKYHAQVIHSHSSVWAGCRENLIKYTLHIPGHWGYLLHASHISNQPADDFSIPSWFKNKFEDYVYTSQITLLRPSEASGECDDFFEQGLNHLIEECSLYKKPEKPMINVIETSANGFVMKERAVSDNFEIKDLDVNYGAGFEKFHQQLMARFSSSTKGLVLFHGLPGTGKTYYIRHLLRRMVASRKIVIYMPPNMVDHLVDPMFMTFLAQQVQQWSEDGNFCVLLIEDAEPLLAKRQEGVRIQGVTNLLNMSDGLLNDMLNLQIICTFNVDLRKLDSALLRPGRLIARKEFKALSVLDANLLAHRLGIKHHFTEPATLSEIYALRKDQNTLIHDVEPDQDASTILDDLI